MEIDVSISASHNGISLDFKNALHLDLNDTDSSLDSLLTIIESDGTDLTVSNNLIEDLSLNTSHCSKSADSINSSDKNNLSYHCNIVSSLSLEGGNSFNSVISNIISDSKNISHKGKHRNSTDSVDILTSKYSKKQFNESLNISNSRPDIFLESNCKSGVSNDIIISAKSSDPSRSLILDLPFQEKNNSEYISAKKVSSSLKNSETNVATIDSSIYSSKNPKLFLNHTFDENKNIPVVCNSKVLNTNKDFSDTSQSLSSAAYSSRSFNIQEQLSEKHYEYLSPNCEMLKLHSRDEAEKKIGNEIVLKPTNAIMSGYKHRNEIDVCSNKLITHGNLIIDQSRNMMCNAENNPYERKPSSHSNHLPIHSSKSKKEQISSPLNQNIVLVTEENELKVASIQSVTQNKIVIETSPILKNRSDKKKIRLVFPMKRTKSKLSNIINDLDTSFGNQTQEKLRKKLKRKRFTERDHSPTIVDSKLDESKDPINLSSIRNTKESIRPTCKRIQYLQTPETNKNNGNYLSKNMSENAVNGIGQGNNIIADVENFNEKVIIRNNHQDILPDISKKSGYQDLHTVTAFDKQNKSTKDFVKIHYKQDPLFHESKELCTTLKMCSPKQNMCSNHSSQQLYLNSESTCIDTVKSKVCSPSPPVSRISPLHSEEFMCNTPKSIDSKLHFHKSFQNSGFQNKGALKSNIDLPVLDRKVVGNIAKVSPNISEDSILPTLNLSHGMLKEKLGLVAKHRKFLPVLSYLKKKKVDSCENMQDCKGLSNLIPPNNLLVYNSLAIQKLSDLLELVILSKDYLGFIAVVIEKLLTEIKKCNDSNRIIIFDTLSEKSALSAFKMCKFILEKTKQTLLPGSKLDNVKLSLKAIESILCIANINLKLSTKLVSDATIEMSEVEIFLFVRTFIECYCLPIPELEDLQPFCYQVKQYSSSSDRSKKICNSEKIPELYSSSHDTVSPHKADHANEIDKLKCNNNLSFVKKYSAKTNNKDVMNRPIEKPVEHFVSVQTLKKNTLLNADAVSGCQNMQSDSTYKNKSNNSIPVSVVPSFTREQMEKIVENFSCFDQDIQGAISGYLKELSQTAENANYAYRLLKTIKNLSA